MAILAEPAPKSIQVDPIIFSCSVRHASADAKLVSMEFSINIFAFLKQFSKFLRITVLIHMLKVLTPKLLQKIPNGSE